MIDFHGQLKLQYPTKDYIPVVYESAELQDNLEHSGGITISWNAATDDEIPMGAYVTYGGMRYILLEPYAPNKASAVPHYRYEPQFKHPQNMLDRIPFWIKSLDASGTPINLQTTSFTGYPHTIAKKLVDFLAEYANDTGDTFFADTMGLTYDESTGWSTSWKYDIPGTLIDNVIRSEHVIITVGFDGCSIKSAANAIADAMGCNVFWDWSTKTIRFVVGSTIQGEAYNCFHVLGGTTNMGKSVVSGGFAAVTQRLTLPEPDNQNTPFDINSKSYALLKGSIISAATEGGIRLTTDLIFDEIYPKQELFIKSARQRLCYCTDENGEFIVDHYLYYYMDGDTKVYAEVYDEVDGVKYDVDDNILTEEPVLKTFAKWYLTFATSKTNEAATEWPGYTFQQEYLIDDKPLGLLFQIDFANPENMSSLVGQQFDMTYYPTEQTEHDRNDVSPSFTVNAGEFFVAVKAQGDMLLPTVLDIESKGTIYYAYKDYASLPEGSETILNRTAVVKGSNRIYSCANYHGQYVWISGQPVSDNDIYKVRQGNLDGKDGDENVLSDRFIVWNGGTWSEMPTGFAPRVGDKVTLVNMALSDEQIDNAKEDLFAAAKEIIASMTLPSGEYSETVILGKSKDNTGQVITSVSVGEETIFERNVQNRKHGPIVTQIQQNLDTGIMQATVGSWTRKTKTGGTVDKLETVTVSSSSPTTGGDSYSDGSIGSGGGYGGTSGKETETINQTVLKPDSLFLASLGNTIDAVSCDADGKVRIESNIYSMITGKYGTKDVTASCTVSVPSLPTDQSQTAGSPLKPRIYIEASSTGTSGTEIAQTNLAYELTDSIRWIRIHMPEGYDMSLLEDNYTQLFSIEHPAFTERGLSMTIQAMREGEQGEQGEQGEEGQQGEPGQDAVVAYASTDKISVPCNVDGSVISAVNRNVTFYLKKGEETLTVTGVSVLDRPNGVTVTSVPDNDVKSITIETSATAEGIVGGVTFTVTGSDADGNIYSAIITIALIGAIQGYAGLQGCVVRVSEWKVNQEYRNDENNRQAVIGYIDVTAIEDSNEAVGYKFYQCKELETAPYYYHTSTNDDKPGTGANWQTYWTLIQNVGPIYTSLLIAKNAYIKYGTGNQFIITDSQNVIKAGLKGDGDIRFWAGSTSFNPSDISADNDSVVANAPFRVYHDGSAYMTNAHVAGEIEANTGHIGGTDGWAITAKNLVSGTVGADASMKLSTENFSFSTGSGSSLRSFPDLRFSIGSKFGIQYDGTIIGSDAKFFDGFKFYDQKVEVGQSDLANNYVWRGLAVKFGDANLIDLATFGIREKSSAVSYGKIVLTRRNADGTYETNMPVEISGEDGSAKFAGNVLAGCYRMDLAKVESLAAGRQYRITEQREMIIVYGSGDTDIILDFTAEQGSVLIIRRTANSGTLKVYKVVNGNVELASESAGAGTIICLYNNGWQ